MDDKTILIIGSNGQLGTALKLKYPGATAIDAEDLDITSEERVGNFDFKPFKVVVNAAAYTNVDGAETSEGRVLAWKVNASALSLLIKKIANQDITFVHISTDYVFDGTKENHKEDEPFSPLGVYGQTKAAGDLVVRLHEKSYILRTSWVIGEGKNFVRTMLELGKKGVDPTVVSDAYGRPTFTNELVRAIDHLLIGQLPYGTYNLSNSGEQISWAGFARAIFDLAKLNITVVDTSDSEYYANKLETSPRPLNSTFDLGKINSTGFISTDWKVDLEKYITKELEEK